MYPHFENYSGNDNIPIPTSPLNKFKEAPKGVAFSKLELFYSCIGFCY